MIYRGVLAALVCATLAGDLRAQAAVSLPAFNAVEVRNGGHVVLRPGPAQRVSVVTGSRENVSMTVTASGVLIIDNCPNGCPPRSKPEVEVVVPSLRRVSLAHGGRVWTAGAFPRQAELIASVSNGGTVDVRSIPADRVNASVEQGGRVLTIPRESLVARVSNGGVVTWWGNAQVRRSVEHGGVVQKGEPDEVSLPLSEIGLPLRTVRRHR